MEIWKDIDESYEVSNKGNVRSKDRIIIQPYRGGSRKHLRKGKTLAKVPSKDGYLRVKIHNNYTSLSHLVATAFIPNPNKYTVVHHKDHNPHNNNVENLEWIDENVHNNLHKEELRKIVDQISPIDGEVVKTWSSTCECGKNGFNQAHVSDCCLGKRKIHKGYMWKYPL